MIQESDLVCDVYDRMSWGGLDRRCCCSAFATSQGSDFVVGVCEDSELHSVDSRWHNIVVWNISKQCIVKRFRIPFGILTISSLPCETSVGILYIISSLYGNKLYFLNAELGNLKEILVCRLGLTQTEIALSPKLLNLVEIDNAMTIQTAEKFNNEFDVYWDSMNHSEEKSQSSAFLFLHDALRRLQEGCERKNSNSNVENHYNEDSTLYLISHAVDADQPFVLLQVKLRTDAKDITAECTHKDDPLEFLSFKLQDARPLDWPGRVMGMAYSYERRELTLISEHKNVSVYSASSGRLLPVSESDPVSLMVSRPAPGLSSADGDSSTDCISNLKTLDNSDCYDVLATEQVSGLATLAASPAAPPPAPPAAPPAAPLIVRGPIPRLLDYHSAVVYIVHKPLGCLSSTRDCEEAPRGTVYEVVARAGFPRVGLVGRLDGDTSGIMVFTNDGRLNDRILRPPEESDICVDVDPDVDNDLIHSGAQSGGDGCANETADAACGDRKCSYLRLKEKEYTLRLLQGRNNYCMENGVFNTQKFEDEFGLPLVFNRCNTEYNVREATIKVIRRYQDAQFNKHERADQGWVVEVQVNINEGKHQQIRRLARRAGYHVVGLKRTKICGGLLSLDSVTQPGDCRWLSEEEKYALYKGFKLI